MSLLDKNEDIYQKHLIFAGKFRRYHGVPLWKQIIDIPTILLNLRDLMYVVIGFFQSLWLMLSIRPKVVFVKGGYVGIPVGMAAGAFHRKIVTHDSDALPGLANRFIAPWTTVHTTGLPIANYNYPPSKTEFVGIPIGAGFTEPTRTQVAKFKKELKIASKKPIVFITGGSQGAERINNALVAISQDLIKKAYVVHICGDLNYDTLVARLSRAIGGDALGKNYRLLPFIPNEDYAKYSGVAEVVIGRSGGSSTAEFAAQAKPLIMVPNPRLTGGHQLANAKVYDKEGAALIVNEEDMDEGPKVLAQAIIELLGSSAKRQKLSKSLQKFAKPNAARDIAKIISKLSE